MKGLKTRSDELSIPDIAASDRLGGRVTTGQLVGSRDGRYARTPVFVPTVSMFYGIVIRMFVKDHRPPHFHALYGEHRARVSIASGDVLDGDLPPRAARLVREWTTLRRDELAANWARAERMEPLRPIEPLP